MKTQEQHNYIIRSYGDFQNFKNRNKPELFSNYFYVTVNRVVICCEKKIWFNGSYFKSLNQSFFNNIKQALLNPDTFNFVGCGTGPKGWDAQTWLDYHQNHLELDFKGTIEFHDGHKVIESFES